MKRLWNSRSAAMALGSMVFQGATILMLLAFKRSLGAEGFAFLITQLAWASILGSVATLRLELLLFQERGQIDRAGLLTTLVFALVFLALLGAVINGGSAALGLSMPLAGTSLALALGYGLHEAQSFLCVQLQRLPELVVTRFVQAAGLMLAAYAGWRGADPATSLIIFTCGLTLPLLAWFGVAILRAPGAPGLHLPERPAWFRGLFLLLSTLTNTIYANLAVLAASISQNSAFVADFGFIVKLLTGPISLIRQTFGHTFLASAFAIDRSASIAARQFWSLARAAMLRSMAFYVVILVAVVAFLFLTADLFGIERPEIILWLSLVSIAQVSVNTIASIRTPLCREGPFLRFDIARTLVYGVMLVFPFHLPFEIAFAAASAPLYIAYIWFIRYHISKIGPL